ncbi:MAG: hypothetical protein KatS3mg117_1606 [Geminicoccaceae bacterium]|nr:MAG: hypothetical protein KatS3mg117_1606 [Geminicoccaceae bacterium]
MKLAVFIHTNEKQYVGALVSAHSMRRFAKRGDALDIRILHTKDFPWLWAREGQKYKRGREWREWRMDDLQSFTPLRFAPPEAMGYEGRAVIVDPDIFAVGDIGELLTREMDGKAILCRKRPGKEEVPGHYATSCMLLDCAKLRHWQVEKTFAELFTGERDYAKWIELEYEDPATIGLFEPEWNDFDHLDEKTKLIHNTKRHTQPWKTGLPIDFVEADKFKLWSPKGWVQKVQRSLFGHYRYSGTYKPHPDRRQETLFFALLKDAMRAGVLDEALLREHMAKNHVRHDALEVLARTPDLDRLDFLGRSLKAAA